MKHLIKLGSDNRIWHPYWLLEENNFNMWGNVENNEKYLQKAIKFIRDHKLYGKYMLEVVKQWKYSCEHNLSCITQNRRAWIGHAACALAMKCPEHIVREAWGFLTEKQQILANKEADKAIRRWEKQNKNIWQRKD